MRTLRTPGLWLVVGILLHTGLARAAAECDLSDRSAGKLVADLGRLAVRDDNNNTDYSFAVCQTYDVFEQKGWLMVVGSPITSTRLDQAEAEQLARASDGKECITRGAPYSPSPGDPRLIEYRFCQQGGRPARMEVVVRALDGRGAPRPVRSLSVPWPDLRSPPRKPQPFVPLSPSDKTASCDDNEKLLGQLSAEDDGNMTTYRFVVCQGTDAAVSVRSNFLTGTRWDARAIAAIAVRRDCEQAGAPYGQQGAGDHRSIRYRLCGHGGAPPTVEVDAVTLDAQWRPRPPRSVSAPISAIVRRP